MAQFVGVDVGRAKVAVATSHGVRTFPSLVGEARALRLGAAGDYQVELDGSAYFVGLLAEESWTRREMATESKLHDETRVLFATALGIAHPPAGVVVVTGLPVEQHTPETKAALQRLLGTVQQVTVNGVTVHLHVGRLLVVPEGAGAFWAEAMDDAGMIRRPDLIGSPASPVRCRVLDLGSRTVNYVTLVGGRYLDRESGTLPYGLLELRHMPPGQEAAFARRIMADLSQRVASLQPTDTVLLAGGGALALGPHLLALLPNAHVLPEPVTANARGYRKLGMAHVAAAQ